MIAMLRHHLTRHRYKVAMGLPIAVLIASSLSFIRSTDQMCLIPDENRFVEVGEEVTIHIHATSDTPINVVGGVVYIPTDTLTVERIDTTDSIVTLWVEEPSAVSETGRIPFSGGVVRAGGFTGSGHVFSVTLRPIREGTATLTFEEGSMLAHDGTGHPVACTHGPLTLYVRAPYFPSPDVNDDGKVNIFDFSIISARVFMPYHPRYDLNVDGKVNHTDVGIVVGHMSMRSSLGGLVLFADY